MKHASLELRDLPAFVSQMLESTDLKEKSLFLFLVVGMVHVSVVCSRVLTHTHESTHMNTGDCGGRGVRFGASSIHFFLFVFCFCFCFHF